MEAVSYTVIIPGVMRGKGRPRFTSASKFGRAYTDSKTIAAEGSIASHAFQQIGSPCLDGPVALRMCISVVAPKSWPKKRRANALAGLERPVGKPDLDNSAKLVCDALNGIAWRDDSQIVSLHVTKMYAEKAETELLITGHSTDLPL